MKKGLVFFCILLSVLLGNAASASCAQNTAAAHTDAVLNLDELIAEALQANPDIEAAKNKRDALWQRPPQAKAWDDPRLEFGVRNVPADDADFSKINMTMKEASLSQSIPLAGIPSLREKIAIQEAKSADRLHDYTRLQIIREVKKTYFDLYLLNRHIETAEKNKGILAQLVKTAGTQYAVGKAAQQDVLKAQLEQSKFIETLIDLQQQKTTAAAQMNRLLGRDPSAPLLGEPQLEQKTVALNVAELIDTAKTANPALLSLQEIIARNEADYQLARKSYVPALMITGAYGQRENMHRSKAYPAFITGAAGSAPVTIHQLDQDTERSDLFSLMLGINIPIWFKNKQNRKVAETHHMIEQAKAEYTALAHEIAYRIRDLAARQKRETELLELYERGIIAQANQSLNAAIAGYQVGTVDFLTLLDSQVTLCNAELQASQARAQYQKNLAELEAVVGKELF
ncbi:MAG: TolC family protein [Deltaproteobacteria bacterium]|nr:TolC family protein [Deltaproteobacteria bacterium]